RLDKVQLCPSGGCSFSLDRLGYADDCDGCSFRESGILRAMASMDCAGAAFGVNPVSVRRHRADRNSRRNIRIGTRGCWFSTGYGCLGSLCDRFSAAEFLTSLLFVDSAGTFRAMIKVEYVSPSFSL